MTLTNDEIARQIKEKEESGDVFREGLTALKELQVARRQIKTLEAHNAELRSLLVVRKSIDPFPPAPDR